MYETIWNILLKTMLHWRYDVQLGGGFIARSNSIKYLLNFPLGSYGLHGYIYNSL